AARNRGNRSEYSCSPGYNQRSTGSARNADTRVANDFARCSGVAPDTRVAFTTVQSRASPASGSRRALLTSRALALPRLARDHAREHQKGGADAAEHQYVGPAVAADPEHARVVVPQEGTHQRAEDQ